MLHDPWSVSLSINQQAFGAFYSFAHNILAASLAFQICAALAPSILELTTHKIAKKVVAKAMQCVSGQQVRKGNFAGSYNQSPNKLRKGAILVLGRAMC